jgi:hypothetical protein
MKASEATRGQKTSGAKETAYDAKEGAKDSKSGRKKFKGECFIAIKRATGTPIAGRRRRRRRRARRLIQGHHLGHYQLPQGARDYHQPLNNK